MDRSRKPDNAEQDATQPRPGESSDEGEPTKNSGASTTTAGEKVADLQWDLRWDSCKRASYHQARAAFLRNLHRTLMYVVVVSGTAIFSDVIQSLGTDTSVQQWVAIVPVAAALLDLIMRPSELSSEHDLTYIRFMDIFQNLAFEEVSADELEVAQHKFHEAMIHAPREVYKTALDAVSHNQACVSFGREEELRVGWFRNMTKQWVGHGSHNFAVKQD